MWRRDDAIPSFEIPKACIAIHIKSLQWNILNSIDFRSTKNSFKKKNCFLIFWHTEWRPVYVQRCCRRQHSMSASFFTDFIKWSNAWNSVLQLIFSFVLTVATNICKRFSRVFDLYELVQNILLGNISRVHTNTRTMLTFRTAYHSILIIDWNWLLEKQLNSLKTSSISGIISSFPELVL